MTKAEIIDRVYDEVGGLSKKEAAELVESFFDIMKEELAQGRLVKLSGYGNFIVRDKERRMGLNPRTKQPHPIKARRVVRFKYSQILKSILNPPEKANSKQE
ncbi:MAG: integration host factor subunit alpha [Myxococcales bacterium]|nr:integration host factor subunit alpha [Myxococcales bacterium]MCB9708209.1 integration host factor subunit alpha [Myxococcales bacterium]